MPMRTSICCTAAALFFAPAASIRDDDEGARPLRPGSPPASTARRMPVLHRLLTAIPPAPGSVRRRLPYATRSPPYKIKEGKLDLPSTAEKSTYEFYVPKAKYTSGGAAKPYFRGTVRDFLEQVAGTIGLNPKVPSDTSKCLEWTGEVKDFFFNLMNGMKVVACHTECVLGTLECVQPGDGDNIHDHFQIRWLGTPEYEPFLDEADATLNVILYAADTAWDKITSIGLFPCNCSDVTAHATSTLTECSNEGCHSRDLLNVNGVPWIPKSQEDYLKVHSKPRVKKKSKCVIM